MRPRFAHAVLLAASASFAFSNVATASPPENVQSLLLEIKGVGKEGARNSEVQKAWRELVRLGPSVMPEVLAGMDGATPTAMNWLRGAVEAVADKTLSDGNKLPTDRLTDVLKNKTLPGKARRLAFDLLTRVDPKTPDRLLPGMLDDPSQELRRDAVVRAIESAKKKLDGPKDDAKKAFQTALRFARDRDQVNEVAKQLKSLGETVDLTKHYGFITEWAVVGPFDNSKGVGFHNVYPPERKVDLAAEYAGKADEKIQWKQAKAHQPLGIVDFNKIFGDLKGTTAYAFATVNASADRNVEIRVGSNNAVRIYVNGKEVYFREEYHHGMEMDQHIGQAKLNAGPNEILIKVCQNEQTESWATLWSFQLRVSDELGAAIPVGVVTPRLSKSAP